MKKSTVNGVRLERFKRATEYLLVTLLCKTPVGVMLITFANTAVMAQVSGQTH